MKDSVNLVSSMLPDLSSKASPQRKEVARDQSDFTKHFDSALKRADKPAEKTKKDVKAANFEEASPAPSEKSVKPLLAKKVSPSESFAPSVHSSEEVQNTLTKENAEEDFDDKQGLIAQSYSQTAVSYPISRIAQESLDDDTKASLKEQGLWNLPTMVAAEPSPQLMAMKEVSESSPLFPMATQSESPVQVAKPIAQFMASLENELGVKPDRLVQAFRNLPPGQLQLSPEKTMIQVIKNLKLDPADQVKVTELYSKMLAQLQMQTDLQSSQGAQAQAAMMAASGASLVAPQKDAFTEDVAPKAMAPSKGQGRKEAAALGYAKADALATPPVKTESVSSKLSESEKGEANKFTAPKGVVDGKVAQPLSASALAAVSDQPSTNPATQVIPEGMTKLAQPEAVVADQTAAQAQVQPNVSTQTNLQNPAAASLVAGQMKAQEAAHGGAKEVASADKRETATKVTPDTGSVLGGMARASNESAAPAPQGTKNEVAVGAGMAATEMKKDGDAKHEAIRSIVSNAQLLAAKGGGEIRMTLKPDHMGEIQLKVAMEGNKVNIQMTTDRGEVKKLIEQSVHELRHGLATHNLSMEKMDVSFNQKDMSGFSKGQPDFSQARDFSQNFHQQQSDKRGLMEDLSALRSNAPKSLGMLDRSAQVQRAMMPQTKTSGRLNVVA